MTWGLLFRTGPTLAQSANKGPDPSSSSGSAHKRTITERARPQTTAAMPAVTRNEQRPRPRKLQLESGSSILPVGKILSTPTVMGSSKLRKDRVFVLPHSSQSTIQEGDHVRVLTTQVEPGSPFIGPVLVGPMRGPWLSVGGYKYPLLQEGQVFIHYTPT